MSRVNLSRMFPSLHRFVAILALCSLLGMLAGSAVAQQIPDRLIKPKKTPYTEAEIQQMEAPGPNPFLSYLPAEAEVDWDYWLARMRMDGRERGKRMALRDGKALEKLIVTGESEPNDTPATGDFISGFGTAPGKDPAADVSGALAAPPAPTAMAALPEDEGSITLATNTALTVGGGALFSGTVGDGSFGSGGAGSGDFDFYRVTATAAGQVISVNMDTPVGPLDTFVAIHDSTGAVVAFNDDEAFGILDSLVLFAVPSAGDYFVSVGGFLAAAPSVLSNPFNSASGPGAGSEGAYNATIGLGFVDVDVFKVNLRRGDMFGASVSGAGTILTMQNSAGSVLVESTQDASFIYPATSPLPGGGNAVFAWVVSRTATYTVRVASAGTGAYTLGLRAFRNPLTLGAAGVQQTLFLDFDGATVNPAIFGGPAGSATLSPLSSFLAGWGLTAADESSVIDAIVQTVTENVSDDIREFGKNYDFDATGIPGQFDIEILNSRDHADPFGSPNVSRLIVGGTIAQLGISTIGIAESIDPGNFETGESAVTLLDLLSNPSPLNPNSLNQFALDPSVSIVDLIGVGVGNITAHEAGHFIGNFHTEQFVTLPNIMDQGGNLANSVGVGPDGIFGSADDIDVDFGEDIFVPSEGFVGTEDTLNVVSFGCPTPEAATVIIDGCNSGVANIFVRNFQLTDVIGDCAASATTHLDFTNCTRGILKRLVNANLLPLPDAISIFNCATAAAIP